MNATQGDLVEIIVWSQNEIHCRFSEIDPYRDMFGQNAYPAER